MQITRKVILLLFCSRENVVAFLFFLILISMGLMTGKRGGLILVFSSIYFLVPVGFNFATNLVDSLIENS